MPPNIGDAQCVNNRSKLSVRWFIVTLRLILWTRLCCANQRSSLCDSLKYATHSHTHTHSIHRGRSRSGVALWLSRKVSSSTIVTALAAICRLRSTVYYFPCLPLIIQFLLRRITWLNFHAKSWRRDGRPPRSSGDRSDGDHNNRQSAPLLRAACGLCPIYGSILLLIEIQLV